VDRYSQARQLIQEKRFAEAETVLREATTMQPEDTTMQPEDSMGWQLLGSVLHSLQKPAESLEAFRQAATVAPSDVKALFNYGVALQMAGKNETARQQFEAILRLSPAHEGATQRLAALNATSVPIVETLSAPPAPPAPAIGMAPMGMSSLGSIGGNQESPRTPPPVYAPPTENDYPPEQVPDPPTSYRSGRHNHTQDGGDAGRLTVALIVGFVVGALCCYGWWWVVNATGFSWFRILPAAGVGWLIGIAVNMTYQKDDDKAAGGAALIALLLLTPTLILVWMSARYSSVIGIIFSIFALFVGIAWAFKTNQGLDFDDNHDD
jgi:tetratricopeptide (TPR) repeat protein